MPPKSEQGIRGFMLRYDLKFKLKLIQEYKREMYHGCTFHSQEELAVEIEDIDWYNRDRIKEKLNG